MKKITRLFMALALCGAAFVYTSCTDFTEDIKSVNTRVDNLDKQHSADIKSLQDQAASLQTQITALETAKAAAEKNINLLQNQVAALEAFQKTATEDIASIKTQHEVDFKNLKADIEAANANILALQKFQEKAEAQIEALQEADKLINKTLGEKVDTETFNAAIKKAYEDFAKLDDFNDLKDKYLTLTAGATMTIAQIEAAIETVATNLEQAKIDLKALIDTNAGKIAANRKSIDSLCTAVANNLATIENELQPGLKKAKEDIVAINEVLPTLATKAEVKTKLENLYNVLNARIEADSLALVATNENVDSLCDEVTALKANKVEVSVYNDKMSEIDNALATCAGQITADSLAITKLQAWVAEYEPVIDGLSADVTTLKDRVVSLIGKVDALEDAFVNRIQSLVFVPEYDDLCAQAYDYVLGGRNEFADQPQIQNAESVEGNGAIVDVLTDILKRLWKVVHEEPIKPTQPDVLNLPQYLCTGWNNVLESEDEPTDWSLGYNVVYGTFQVYPANLATQLKDQFEKGNVGMLMQFVGLEASREANAFIPSEDLEVLNANDATGYLYVRARFETTKISKDGVPTVEEHHNFVDKPAAISLYIFDNADVVEEAEAEGEDDVVVADLGRYICSHYVPVNVSEVNLADNYVLAGVEDHKEYKTRKYNPVHNLPLPSFFNLHELPAYTYYGQSIEKAWDLVNSNPKEDYVDFQNGFEPQIAVGEDPETQEIMSLAAAAEEYFLPVECITPNLNLSYDYTDYYETQKDETKAGNIAGEFAVDETKAAVEMKDTTKAAVAIDWVNDQVTALSMWTLHTVPVLVAFDTYTIGWREITLHHALDTLTTYPWTYEFALAHADTGYLAPSQENVQPNETEEVVAICTNKTAEQGFDEINFAELLQQVPSCKVYQTGDESKTALEGWLVKAENGTSDPEALTFTADLSTTGYSFSKEATTDVTAELQYKDDETKSRVVVTYDFQYGLHPNDLVFEFTKDDFYYEPQVVFLAIDTFSFDNAVAKDAAYADYFTDNAEFLQSFKKNINSDRSASKAFTGDVEREVSAYSKVCLSKDEYPQVVDLTDTKVRVRLSQADVKTYGDTFKFVNKLTTWYGTSYTIIANIGLKAPGFKLSYWSNKVVEQGGTELYPAPYAMLEGTYDNQRTNDFPPYILNDNQGAYVVDQDNLSQYYKLTANDGSAAVVTAAEKKHLTVKYSILTTENEAEGFKNVPAIDADKEEVTVTYQPQFNNFLFGACPVKWSLNGNAYTARKLATKATLYCNGVYVNELTLNLYINDPISKYELKEQVVKRPRVQNYDYDTVFFWKNLNIEGILNNGSEKGESVNLIDVDYNGAEGETPYLFGNPYDIKLTFGKNDIQILEYLDFENNPSAYNDVTDLLGIQVFYNDEKGYIVYNNNSAVRQTDIVVKVKLSLEHKFNYLNNPVYEKEQHYKALTYTLLWPKQNLVPGNAE